MIILAKSPIDGDFFVQKSFIFSNARYSIISQRKQNKYNACISKCVNQVIFILATQELTGWVQLLTISMHIRKIQDPNPVDYPFQVSNLCAVIAVKAFIIIVIHGERPAESSNWRVIKIAIIFLEMGVYVLKNYWFYRKTVSSNEKSYLFYIEQTYLFCQRFHIKITRNVELVGKFWKVFTKVADFYCNCSLKYGPNRVIFFNLQK